MRAGPLSIVLVVMAAVSGCDGGSVADPPSTTAGPVTTAVPVPTTGSTFPDHGPEAFRSPTGNIGCILSDTSVRCDIAEHRWSPPPRPADCEQDWGFGLQLDERGARFFCAGDSAMSGDAVLAYGKSAARGGVLCSSEPAGMSCVHGVSGRGFTLARTSYRFFVQCMSVAFTPESEDAASDVRATGVECPEAEAFVRQAGGRTSSGGPDAVDVDGYRCRRTRADEDPLPRSFYECRRGDATVSFVRS